MKKEQNNLKKWDFNMPWYQKTFRVKPTSRGFHLITHVIENELKELAGIEVGIAHIFIHHTSASLTINENADPTVREDFESHFNHMIPENAPYYEHTFEGSDDMPAHLKASLLGSSITVPIKDGRLYMGTWQGIYLCEHRNHSRGRTLTVTIHGE